MTAVTAIVLAGGASSRFGGDKLAAPLDGRPILHHALAAVAAVAEDVVLVLAPGAPDPALPADLRGRVRIARDPVAGGGPLAGLVAGLDLVRDDAPRIALVVGGDMPWLHPGVLRALIEALGRDPGMGAMTLDASVVAPLPLALRPVVVRAAVAECLAGGRRSLRALLDAVPSATLPAAAWRALDPEARTLRDVDTPGDLDRR